MTYVYAVVPWSVLTDEHVQRSDCCPTSLRTKDLGAEEGGVHVVLKYQPNNMPLDLIDGGYGPKTHSEILTTLAAWDSEEEVS